jgi:hypothetical protein
MKMRVLMADLSLDGLGHDAWHRWGHGPGHQSVPADGYRAVPATDAGAADRRHRHLRRRTGAVIAARTGRADIVLHAVHWRSVYESATSRRRCESRARKGVTIVDVGSKAELRDDGGPPRAAYGFAPGDMALIRPDGYIGVLASGGDHGALDDYLKQFA